MLENGGRIFTAAVGVVALVVAVIFVGHGVLTRPFTPSGVSDSSIIESAPPGVDDSVVPPDEGNDVGDEEGGDGPTPGSGEEQEGTGPYGQGGVAGGSESGGGGDGGTTEHAPEPYTATSIDIVSPFPAAVDVTLPQVAGGDPKITDAFNSAMRAALNDRIAEMRAGGRLTGSDGEVAHIGEGVISGVLLVTAEYEDTAVDLADTVVLGTDSGTILTFDDIFTDTDAGLQQLAAQSKELGPSTDAGTSFDPNAVTAEPQLFSRWLATPDGMRIYFKEESVAPGYDGLVELTVPWQELSDVLDPDMYAVLTR